MARKRRPNVLVFIPHDLGDHLHCYGHQAVRSPHLDELAEQGVRFSNYFTTCPECTASRGSMMTGLYPHQNGLMGLAGWGWELFPGVEHLAQRLAQHRYVTHLFGFQHETAESPERLGYEQVHRCPSIHVADVCRVLCEFLGSQSAKAETPWFACAGFKHVHRPWDNTPVFTANEVETPPYLPDNPVVREDLTHFYQDILEMDAAIGQVLETLRGSSVYQDTLVVFTTDHGIGFPRAKATFYDPGIHVPLIMHWPGRIEGGLMFDQLLSNIDFTPTILDLCGLPTPDGIAGRSFRALLDGAPYEEREAVFGALFYDVSYDPMHYVRTRDHKYLRSFAVTDDDAEGADPRVLATFVAGRWIRVDDADVMSSAAWRSLDVDCSRPPAEELYDLRADPLEQRDLAGAPEAAATLNAMRTALTGMMRETDSPLLSGHVAPPPVQVEKCAAHRRYLGISTGQET